MNLQRLQRLMLLIFTFRPLEWSPKSGECMVLVPMHLHFIQILSRAHPLPLPITYNTLFDERLREELQEIQENLHRKNEEIQQKNEEMQKQIEEMKKKEEERLKREDEMQQKILHMKQIMCKLAQTSSIYQPPVEDPSRSPEVTTHTDSK